MSLADFSQDGILSNTFTKKVSISRLYYNQMVSDFFGLFACKIIINPRSTAMDMDASTIPGGDTHQIDLPMKAFVVIFDWLISECDSTPIISLRACIVVGL